MIANLSPEDKAELADSTALCRMGTAEDVGDAIALLASERARFVTGQVFGDLLLADGKRLFFAAAVDLLNAQIVFRGDARQ